VDAPVMASGAYNYSLQVDGKLIGTKQEPNNKKQKTKMKTAFARRAKANYHFSFCISQLKLTAIDLVGCLIKNFYLRCYLLQLASAN
jgi:hypothetical protein